MKNNLLIDAMCLVGALLIGFLVSDPWAAQVRHQKICDVAAEVRQASDKKWHQLLIDQDFAHYDGKTGEWKLYTKEEFLMNHQIPIVTDPRADEALFPLPADEPAVVPKTKKK